MRKMNMKVCIWGSKGRLKKYVKYNNQYYTLALLHSIRYITSKMNVINESNSNSMQSLRAKKKWEFAFLHFWELTFSYIFVDDIKMRNNVIIIKRQALCYTNDSFFNFIVLFYSTFFPFFFTFSFHRYEKYYS